MRTIREIVPEAEEAIRYGIPTFRLYGNLVHFAAFRNQIGFYPGPSAIDAFRNELSSYDLSKGTIRFPTDRSVPLDLVRRIVQYRVKEEQQTGKPKRQDLSVKKTFGSCPTSSRVVNPGPA